MPLCPSDLLESFPEHGQIGLILRIGFGDRHQHADPPHALALLCPRRERPRRCAAEPSDESTPPKANAHLAPACADEEKICPSLSVL
jgi:hypothetical protein